jgi:hypothetical protein
MFAIRDSDCTKEVLGFGRFIDGPATHTRQTAVSISRNYAHDLPTKDLLHMHRMKTDFKISGAHTLEHVISFSERVDPVITFSEETDQRF